MPYFAVMQRAAAKKKRPKKPARAADANATALPVQLLASENGLSDDDNDNEGLSGYRPGGYHPVSIGDMFKQRQYMVLKKLGWGHFSTVWLVKNHSAAPGSEDELVALKIQKSSKRYTEAAKDEIHVLEDLMKSSEQHPIHSKRIVQLVDNFLHLGPHGTHVCFCFETLGENLLVFIKRYNYQGIPRMIVREIAHQVCQGLDYMHRVCKIIHTDLKPENVVCAVPNPRVMEVSDVAAAAAAAAAASASGGAVSTTGELLDPVDLNDAVSIATHLQSCEGQLKADQSASKSKKRRLKLRLKKLREAFDTFTEEDRQAALAEVEVSDGDEDLPHGEDAGAGSAAESNLSQQVRRSLTLGLRPEEPAPQTVYAIAEIESWQRAYLLSDAHQRVLLFSVHSLAKVFLSRRSEDPDLECCIIIGLDAGMQSRIFDRRNWDLDASKPVQDAATTPAVAEPYSPAESEPLRDRFMYFQSHNFGQVRLNSVVTTIEDQ